MSSRQLEDWLTGYLKYTENTEPRKTYHTWIGIALLSSALQRRVRLVWGHETIYPNIYVVLVGPSGRARKGVAMRIGMDLLKDAGILIASEDITREALIRKMKDGVQSFNDAVTNKTVMHCSLSCFSEELSVFLGQNDIRFLSSLTNWYDSRDVWTYETKGGGKDIIQGVCVTLVGATAPDWMSSMFPQEAVGGGFTSRVIFVVEDGKGKVVPDHTLTEEEDRLYEALVKDLEIISGINGPFLFTPQGKEAYINWYKKSEAEIEAGNPAIADPRFEGYVSRRATHLRKICMALSISRSSTREITDGDFERALAILRSAEISMPKAFGGLGKSDYAEATELVLDMLIAQKKILRSELLRLAWRDLDMLQLKVVEEVLVAMKMLRIEIIPLERDVRYTYIGP